MTHPTQSGWMAVLCAGERLLARVESVWMVLAGLTIIVMMVFTVLDVILRYGFNSPLSWWFDVLMNYLLLTPFFLAFSYTLAKHGHLAVEYFSKQLHRPTLHMLLAISFAGAFAVFAIITVLTAIDAYYAWVHDDVLAGVILWPMWIAKALIALGVLPLSLRCLHFSIGHALSVRNPSLAPRLRVVSHNESSEEAP